MTKTTEFSSDNKMQIIKTIYKKFEAINVYRSNTGNKHHLRNKLETLVNPNRITVITGDFNICARQENSNVVTQFLEANGFIQLMKEATQIQGRIIDHVYINCVDMVLDVERYSPYYSDHDAILVSLDIQVN